MLGSRPSGGAIAIHALRPCGGLRRAASTSRHSAMSATSRLALVNRH